MFGGLAAVLRWWWSWLRWAVKRAGYVLRPYDMLADRRRWWWQPRQRCQFARGGRIATARPTSVDADEVVFRISPPTEVVSRELADKLGIVAAWDALDRQRSREAPDGDDGGHRD